MLRHSLKILIVFSICLLLQRCAQVVPLTGGEKDTRPPVLIEAVPADASLNFNADRITLRFDEFVKLKDLKNQLVISPSLKNEPEVSAEGKKVIIQLKKEDLKPNTTYRFFFGESVADMTEGNTAGNIEYVMSTGTNIDSLSLKGKVIYAIDNEPGANMMVGLYKMSGMQDSSVFKNVPDYIARSSKEGEFSFRHLPADKFHVVAFFDKNKNYLYEAESEKIGFLQSALNLEKDSSLLLGVFEEEPQKQFIKRNFHPYHGKVQITFNKKGIFNCQALNAPNGSEIQIENADIEKDTLTVYYHGYKDTLQLKINTNSGQTDTLIMSLPKLRKGALRSLRATNNIPNGILASQGSPEFYFDQILDQKLFVAERIRCEVKKDSVWIGSQLQPNLINFRTVQLKGEIERGATYRVTFDTAAVVDKYGRYNDSIQVEFRKKTADEFGKLSLKLTVNKKQDYLVILQNEKGELIATRKIAPSLSASNEINIPFTELQPGNYRIKVVYDDNSDGTWNTGNYLKRKQPEKIFISTKLIKVTSDWEIEEAILVK